MDQPHRWNHNNFAVAPENMERVAAAVEALFPWTKFVDKPTILGYRLTEDLYEGAVYFRPVAAMSRINAMIAEARRARPEVEEAFHDLLGLDADYRDHCGFMVPTFAEWEERVQRARQLAAERPDWQIEVVDVLQPGDGRCPTTDLCQAFIRVGSLGPLRNTFEMQARLR
jgi:hypothetical protein